MPIVTTSSNRRTKRNSALPVAIAALVIVAAVAVYLGTRPARTQLRPAVPDTMAKTVSVPHPTRTRPVESPDAAAPSDKQEQQLPDAPAEQPASTIATAPTTNSPVIESLANRETEKPHYGKEVEQILAMLASATDSAGAPPLPYMGNIDLNKSLLVAITNDIVIYDTDDERTVAAKERIADMKNQLKEVVDAGGSVEEAIREYHDWINENRRIRAEVISEYRRLVREASQEEANAYIVEANKELEAEGIETVNMGVERRRGTMKARPAGMRHVQFPQERKEP